jgi:ribosomal protein L25 (general stress protein Ctc)
MEALLDATVRTTIGKNEARRTRREGKVPATVYGASSAGGNRSSSAHCAFTQAQLKPNR